MKTFDAPPFDDTEDEVFDAQKRYNAVSQNDRRGRYYVSRDHFFTGTIVEMHKTPPLPDGGMPVSVAKPTASFQKIQYEPQTRGRATVIDSHLIGKLRERAGLYEIVILKVSGRFRLEKRMEEVELDPNASTFVVAGYTSEERDAERTLSWAFALGYSENNEIDCHVSFLNSHFNNLLNVTFSFGSDWLRFLDPIPLFPRVGSIGETLRLKRGTAFFALRCDLGRLAIVPEIENLLSYDIVAQQSKAGSLAFIENGPDAFLYMPVAGRLSLVESEKRPVFIVTGVTQLKELNRLYEQNNERRVYEKTTRHFAPSARRRFSFTGKSFPYEKPQSNLRNTFEDQRRDFSLPTEKLGNILKEAILDDRSDQIYSAFDEDLNLENADLMRNRFFELKQKVGIEDEDWVIVSFSIEKRTFKVVDFLFQPIYEPLIQRPILRRTEEEPTEKQTEDEPIDTVQEQIAEVQTEIQEEVQEETENEEITGGQPNPNCGDDQPTCLTETSSAEEILMENHFFDDAETLLPQRLEDDTEYVLPERNKDISFSFVPLRISSENTFRSPTRLNMIIQKRIRGKIVGSFMLNSYITDVSTRLLTRYHRKDPSRLGFYPVAMAFLKPKLTDLNLSNDIGLNIVDVILTDNWRGFLLFATEEVHNDWYYGILCCATVYSNGMTFQNGRLLRWRPPSKMGSEFGTPSPRIALLRNDAVAVFLPSRLTNMMRPGSNASNALYGDKTKYPLDSTGITGFTDSPSWIGVLQMSNYVPFRRALELYLFARNKIVPQISEEEKDTNPILVEMSAEHGWLPRSILTVVFDATFRLPVLTMLFSNVPYDRNYLDISILRDGTITSSALSKSGMTLFCNGKCKVSSGNAHHYFQLQESPFFQKTSAFIRLKMVYEFRGVYGIVKKKARRGEPIEIAWPGDTVGPIGIGMGPTPPGVYLCISTVNNGCLLTSHSYFMHRTFETRLNHPVALHIGGGMFKVLPNIVYPTQ